MANIQIPMHPSRMVGVKGGEGKGAGGLFGRLCLLLCFPSSFQYGF